MKKVSGVHIPALTALAWLLSFAANAQDYPRKISWQEKPKTFNTIDGKAITQPTFDKASHNDQLGLLPFYYELIPITTAGSISVQLVNATYSIATNIDNNTRQYIKESIQPKAELAIAKKKPGAMVSFLPFRKNGNVIEKLESFTLKITVTPRLQSKAAPVYASSSVLATGTWYKIGVSTEGMYKVDYNFVKNTMGVDPSGISLSGLAIFGNGGGMVPELNSVSRPDDLLENPIMVVDNNSNNRFDPDDYFLFYGQMADAWSYNVQGQSFYHTKNLYTDTNFYFISTDRPSAKRVQPVSTSEVANRTVTDFDERAYHESDDANLLQSGKRWLGDRMTSFDSQKSFSFSFPNLITSTPVKLTSVVAVGASDVSTTTITINGVQVGAHNLPAISVQQFSPVTNTNTITPTFNATGSQINVSYSFFPASDPQATAAAYIDYFEMNFKRALTMSGNTMPFRNIATAGAGNVSNFILSNANSSTRVWDITSLNNISQMQGSLNGSQFSFTTPTNTLHEFIAFNSNTDFSKPNFIGRIENQNLHGMGEAALVIVTYDDFVAASNTLADFHRTVDFIPSAVVKLSQVYNEFGSGKPDISAIRDFVKMLYLRANGDTAKMPRYLLLMGDGSFDPKYRTPTAENFINTYQSDESESPTLTYTSDDFFGLLDSTEGGDITNSAQLMDVGVGRLPVESAVEAMDVVNKIINYKHPKASTANCIQSSLNNSWRNDITFVADDEDSNIHIDASDALAEQTRQRQPKYNYSKIYLDAYKELSTPAGQRYPDVNTAILNKINSGTLLMNWVGHGGPSNWAHERIFNMSDIVLLNNQEKLPLFITATCDFSAFDLPFRTAGEALIVNPKGGGIAAITTVRLVYSNENAIINQAVFDHLFVPYNSRPPKMGEVTMLAKNDANGGGANTRKFCLLGDPAMQLNYPRYDVVTTMLNNKPMALFHDTLKALSNVTIRGEVRDDNGNKMTNFSGVIYPEVYDKITTVSTLGNDAESPIKTFKLFKSILFKGKASVTNGDFSFSFIVPKDINYKYGNGRISYYSDNGNYTDAHGYNEDIVIGGSSDSAAIDKAGPKVKVFMNDEKFVFGGTTDANPVLLVELQDESGINTVGNGVGHDLTAVLDNDNQNKIVLNDYYESDQDNFRKGTVKYPLSNLAIGKHSLTVKAWDIYNNSSEEYMEFIVTSNAKLALNHVYNYPNPFTTHTEFMFEHNRPCDNLDISIQIYTVSGKVVKSISQQQVSCPGYRIDNIAWDGLDDYGDPIGKGVYVYKLSVRDSNGNQANKFEKLVVLR